MKTTEIVMYTVGGLLLYEFILKPKTTMPTSSILYPTPGLPAPAGGTSIVSSIAKLFGGGSTPNSIVQAAAGSQAIYQAPPVTQPQYYQQNGQTFDSSTSYTDDAGNVYNADGSLLSAAAGNTSYDVGNTNYDPSMGETYGEEAYNGD